MNHHLGTTGLSIVELSAVAAKKNMTIDEAMTIPEMEGWRYHGL